MSSQEAILQTLVYFDLFDYPVTFNQLYQYLPLSIQKEQLRNDLKNNQYVEKMSKYYFIKGRRNIYKTRQRREKISDRKISQTRKILLKISKISTVYFIGISGSLAMQNCDDLGDVDIFIIAKKGTIWLTRLRVLFLLQLFGLRRKRGDVQGRDKICLNMILSEENLSLDKKRQNIYGAHEIIQLKPIFDRKNTYNRFLIANNWVVTFLPQAFVDVKRVKHLLDSKLSAYALLFEPLARLIQKLYMKKITEEEVGESILAFHPFDYQQKILAQYKIHLKSLL